MGLFNRLIVIVMVLLAVACNSGGSGGSGNDNDDDNNEGQNEEEVAVAGGVSNGEYEGVGSFALNLILDDLSSNVPPTEADCIGDISIVVDDGAAVEIEGSGQCSLPANVMTYDLEGDLIDDESWEGVITVVLNGRPYDFDVDGVLDGDEIRGEFSGVNIVIGNIRGIWDGEFSAELVD